MFILRVKRVEITNKYWKFPSFGGNVKIFWKIVILIPMGKIFFPLILSLLVAGCGSPLSDTDTIGFTPEGMNTNPPKPLTCEYPHMGCGGICVDVSRDRNNCGWCGEVCGKMEMCYAYHCVDPTYFGFSEGNLVDGPLPYNPIRDLPRPTPNHSDGR